MAELVIYGSPVSPFVRKVAACCIEKDVKFEIDAVNVFDPPEWFLDISPMKRIPVLRDRSIAEEGVEGTVADSSAICGYLEKKHPEPALYPDHPYAHGRVLWIEEYADSNLAAIGGLGIFRPIYFSMMQGKEPDLDTAREAWRSKMPPIFDYLQASLGQNDYFENGELSIADITVACCMMQIALVANLDLDGWPELAAHQERMRARDSIAGPFAKAEKFIRKTVPEPYDLG